MCDIATVAGAPGPPEHMHPSSSELFEVREGAVMVEVDGSLHTLHSGESLTVQAGVPHKFASRSGAGRSNARDFRCAGSDRGQLVTFSELARAGRLSGDGRPSMQQVAVTFSELTQRHPRNGRALGGAARPVSVLAPIGRLRGLKPFYAWGELN